MLVRIATFNDPPADDRDWVIDALLAVPGVRATYHVVDRGTGALLSVSIYDDEATIEAAHAAIARRAEERNQHGTAPDEIRLCEVIRFMDRVVGQTARKGRGMIVFRRTFRCKIGKAGQAAQLLCDVARISREADSAVVATRIYTDLSGPTDRVVLETENSSFDHPRALSAVVHRHPDASAVFRELAEHVTGADVEFLQLEHTF